MNPIKLMAATLALVAGGAPGDAALAQTGAAP